MTEIVSDIARDMELFLQFAKDPSWSSDPDNMKGMAMEIDDIFAEESRLFESIAFRKEGSVNVFEMKWKGDNIALAYVYRDFHRAYGHIAESEQFIQANIEPEAIVFNIVSGCRGENADGHFTQIRLVGERIVQVIREYNESRDSLRKEFEKGAKGARSPP
ncbi:MAG: hypothetical protein JSV43_08020 [Methanobacteriota archaeon]|nr:MAG: hypothetical protein JSV43_08020 [Euryarchaeota archaeon]